MNDNRDADPDISPEYDFADGTRGKYLEPARQGLRLPVPANAKPSPPTPTADTKVASKSPSGKR